MNVLTDLRAAVAADLTAAGVRAQEYVSERVTPPLAVVVPDSPYLAEAADVPFGHYQVKVQVLLIGGKGTNQATADALDDTIVAAVNALGDEWDVTEVSQPGEVQINGHSYLGAVLSIEQTVRLG